MEIQHLLVQMICMQVRFSRQCSYAHVIDNLLLHHITKDTTGSCQFLIRCFPWAHALAVY